MAICIVVPTRQPFQGPSVACPDWPIEAIFVNEQQKLQVKLLFWEEKDCCKTKMKGGIEFELKRYRRPNSDWEYS
jgi:hypothetical protein